MFDSEGLKEIIELLPLLAGALAGFITIVGGAVLYILKQYWAAKKALGITTSAIESAGATEVKQAVASADLSGTAQKILNAAIAKAEEKKP